MRSVTLRTRNQQLTVWSDGVARWDGWDGVRPGSWSSRVTEQAVRSLTAMAEDLQGSDIDDARGVWTVVVEMAEDSASEFTANPADASDILWRLAVLLQGVAAISEWVPMDTTGETNLAPWARGHRLFLKVKGVHAEARATGDGFVVLAGSVARTTTYSGLEPGYRRMREAFIEEGTFRLESDVFVLNRHVLFSSASAAASVMVGRNTNGRTTWQSATGQLWAELESNS